MKKILTLVLALALSITALSGCGSKPAADKTPEELAELYSSAIMENGGEMAEYNPAFTQAKDDDGSAMVLENMGLNTEDMAAFGISASLMNIKAYAIAAIMPAEGKEAAVMEALQGYIDRTKSSFEMYLADQYEVAENARLETLEDGTILLVMCQDQDTVFDAIADATQANGI